LSELIEAKLKDAKAAERKAEAEKRRQDERAERQRQRQQEKDQRAIDKAAEKKAKDKGRAFADISKLESDRGEVEIERLAERLGEEPTAVRDEFSESSASAIAPPSTPSAVWDVEPWAEPVTTAELLRDITAKIDQHFAAKPHEVLAIVLWTAMAWVHEIAATHSAFLTATSTDENSGKSALLSTVSYLTPKPFSAAEATGPTIYRFVDEHKPTFILDEADDIFKRKPDIKHIFNASWTRGTKIPRQVKINGMWTTQWFDPFCPKAIGLIEGNLPRTLISRSIIIKAWPKKPEDKQDFPTADDEVFADLRRKLARWSADNAPALKDAKPPYPAGFANRLQANWRLLLAVAELAGGQWPKKAREAAARLSRLTRRQSWDVQMFEAFQKIFASGRKFITSKEVPEALTADPDSVWCEYNHGGPITQRQVAAILEPYGIHSGVIHPTRRSNLSPRGYKIEQFREMFVHYQIGTPSDAHMRTSQSQSRKRKCK
jgi:putative DNA primase/helicase